MEGEEIVMEIDSVIDATGSIGGGEVLIGGDWQGGANEELRVFDDPDAIIQAEKIFMHQNFILTRIRCHKRFIQKILLSNDNSTHYFDTIYLNRHLRHIRLLTKLISLTLVYLIF